MTLYAIHAQVITHDGAYTGSRQVPTFYLDSRVQGITSRGHAVSVAADVLNPLGTVSSADLRISACAVDPARESAELDASAGVPMDWDRAHALLSVVHRAGPVVARRLLINAEARGTAAERVAGRMLRVAWSGAGQNAFTVASE